MKKRVVTAIIVLILLINAAVLGCSAYNPANSVYYAQLFANSTNPPYFNYYSGGDCTNFVSSCLWNGGFASMDSIPSNQGFGVKNETSKWYSYRFTNVWDYFLGIKYNYRPVDWKTSTTWVRVYNTGSGKGLYQYLVNTKQMPVTICQKLSDVVQYANVGDVIQCAHSGCTPSHSVLVTSKQANDIGFSAHTSARNNESFTAILWSEFDVFYIIHIN